MDIVLKVIFGWILTTLILTFFAFILLFIGISVTSLISLNGFVSTEVIKNGVEFALIIGGFGAAAILIYDLKGYLALWDDKNYE